MLLQQGDGRQEAGTLETVTVEPGGWNVRGEDQRGAGADQCTEQTSE